ncbi:hypothetical protein EX895_000516 [Sporisorium graminicola]|uniref:Mitochondrial outer membrane transport complex Sam37/metaxin N-terminal domain-containing protein n=1 Tax=Sporisorium graminicola TaxID=280036 RepID=A0A4U7L3N3_9BASI|nr:hypothetical protein EX895_000516 [Sporisorium graminicola]TKY90518.1 hypothetical protein EX895_000516 [Sporisorium graminicola]
MSTLENGARTLRLHVWGASTTLPTLDPSSLYAASLLRATFARHESVHLQLASASTSLSRVPLLQVLDDDSSTTIELIDSVEAIRAFCIATGGLDSELASDAELSAKQTALHALMDDQLLDLTLHSLFSLPANYRGVTAPAYSAVGGAEASSSSSPIAKLASLPGRFQPSIPSRLRNVVETRLTAADLWGLGGKEATAKSGEADELAARAGIVPASKKGLGQSAREAVRDEFERSKLVTRWKEVLDVVDAALGEKYLLGVGEVGSLDAHVFGFLAPLFFPKLPVDTLPRLLRTSYPRLAAYLTSLRTQLFPEPGSETVWATHAQLAATPPALNDDAPATSTSIFSYIWPFAPASTTNKASSPSSPSSTAPTDPSGFQPTTPSPRTSRTPKPSASPEDRKLRLGRALWICSALVGLVGYTFASGIPPTDFARHDPSTSCPATTTNPFASSSSSTATTTTSRSSATCPRTHHIVTGTFNSAYLHVLAYDTLDSTLAVTHSIQAEGPHQYLALGVSSTNQQTVYATTWAPVSTLSSWHVSPVDYSLTFGNRREITATGSYVHVQPPPYATLSAPAFGGASGVARWLGSAGGPTGELHRLDAETGLIGERVTELVFLPGGEAELGGADKTRKALRYGAHSFDCSPASATGEGAVGQVAYVADLGANAIQAYSFPEMQHLYTVPSKRAHDGPRHSIPHPHWPVVFAVTEHSNYVDAYQVPAYTDSSSSASVRHVAEADVLEPAHVSEHGRGAYRGDTLRFSSDLRYLYATTRGMTPATRGLVVAYRLAVDRDAHTRELHVQLTRVATFTTRTSGGKANAIELSAHPIKQGVDHMVLTDDEQGWMDILAFDLVQEQFSVEASTRLPDLQGAPQGASHAIWLL